jgi:hypothetical protein
MSPTDGRRRHAGPLLAALLTLIVAGCGAAEGTVVPTAGRTEAVPSTEPTQVATPSSSHAAATPSTTPADVAWRLVNLSDGAGSGAVADIVALPETVVSVAAGGAAGEDAIARSSSDGGATWATESLPGTTSRVGRSIVWGDRVLALGEGDGDCAHPAVTKIWIRDVAGAWKAAPFDPLMCAGGIAQAAATGENAVIVGTGAGDVGFAWSSADGLTWTDRSAAFEGRLPQGVAADGSGFIAFGVGPFPGPAWSSRSVDGSTWEEPAPLAGLAEGAMIGQPVVVDGDVAVFVGDPNGAIGILRPDGSGGWRSALTSGLSRDTLARIVPVGEALVALGGDASGPMAWISEDGTAWRPLALPAEATEGGINAAINGAAILDGRAYLVGQVADGTTASGTAGAVWTGPAELLQP